MASAKRFKRLNFKDMDYMHMWNRMNRVSGASSFMDGSICKNLPSNHRGDAWSRSGRLAMLLGFVLLPFNLVLAASDSEPLIRTVVISKSFETLLDPATSVQSIASDSVWAEGPQCLPDGTFIWSDIKSNKVMSWKEGQVVKDWLSPAHYQNGHALDHEGRLLAASHGMRAIVRKEHDGQWRTLVDRYQGKRLNSPNDLVVAADGAIWFSDPTFGLLNKAESYGGTQEQEGEFIYRYEPNNEVLTRMETPGLKSPNGLAFSPDGSLLYVADSQRAHDFDNHALAHRILVYRVKDGKLSHERVLAEINPGIPDGIKVDAQGNIWSSSQEGVQVLSAEGKLLGKILVNAPVTGNLTICTENKEHWLYIAAANEVFRLKIRVGLAAL